MNRVVLLISETVGGKRSHWTRLCGACTMLVLLGVPWIFSAFGVINAAGNKDLEMLQGIFNVSARSLCDIRTCAMALSNDKVSHGHHRNSTALCLSVSSFIS